MVSQTSTHGMPAAWHELTLRAWAPRGWADFWQHCLVAEGAIDVGCDPVVNLWDFAAVRLIVEEAGGRCSTFDGSAPAHGAPFLTTNGLLHDEIVALLDAPGT